MESLKSNTKTIEQAEAEKCLKNFIILNTKINTKPSPELEKLKFRGQGKWGLLYIYALGEYVLEYVDCRILNPQDIDAEEKYEYKTVSFKLTNPKLAPVAECLKNDVVDTPILRINKNTTVSRKLAVLIFQSAGILVDKNDDIEV